MIYYLIVFILGIGVGGYIVRKFRDEELNTDKCIEYLHSMGYYVNLNVVQKK